MGFYPPVLRVSFTVHNNFNNPWDQWDPSVCNKTCKAHLQAWVKDFISVKCGPSDFTPERIDCCLGNANISNYLCKYSREEMRRTKRMLSYPTCVWVQIMLQMLAWHFEVLFIKIPIALHVCSVCMIIALPCTTIIIILNATIIIMTNKLYFRHPINIKATKLHFLGEKWLVYSCMIVAMEMTLGQMVWMMFFKHVTTANNNHRVA